MTNYTSIEGSEESVKTVFTHIVENDLSISKSTCPPSSYDNVMHIGSDSAYGDVFKAWDDDSKGDFSLYFGTKGDEFK